MRTGDDCEHEDPTTRLKRRLQQRRCLVCGSRDLVNHATSYFCADHLGTYRFCASCFRLQTRDMHGNDVRCKPCSAARVRAYHANNPDQDRYRLRLKKLSMRKETVADRIFAGLRRRIAVAALVAATPGLSWAKRAALAGVTTRWLYWAYQWQCSDALRDVDAGYATLRKRKRDDDD